jgi:hypothetical protein
MNEQLRKARVPVKHVISDPPVLPRNQGTVDRVVRELKRAPISATLIGVTMLEVGGLEEGQGQGQAVVAAGLQRGFDTPDS